MHDVSAADLVMGIVRGALLDGVEAGGVATLLGDAARSRVSLRV